MSSEKYVKQAVREVKTELDWIGVDEWIPSRNGRNAGARRSDDTLLAGVDRSLAMNMRTRADRYLVLGCDDVASAGYAERRTSGSIFSRIRLLEETCRRLRRRRVDER
jgi:hypothetical protein